ncbi:MAG: DUF1559 domain-containing protein, partial [Planctomycetota bacterium]|nr:DUF1559 domain-containing protein [Planctomycetota bacterium]
NKLRQIGLAAQHFHSAKRCYPPGYLGLLPRRVMPTNLHSGTSPPWGESQSVGFLPFLLPYLELDSVYDPIVQDTSSAVGLLDIDKCGDPWWSRETAWHMAHAKISTFVCPSDHRQEVHAVCGMFITPAYIVWTSDGWTGNVGDDLGITSYLGCTGVLGDVSTPSLKTSTDRKRGVFYDRSQTTSDDITDGTSQTMLLGEVHLPGESLAWMGCGVMWTLRVPSSDCPVTFASPHPGIVQFCFADGSVHAVAEDIDVSVFQALGSMQYGEVAHLPED